MDSNSHIGFTIIKIKIKRHPVVHNSDIDYSDDIAELTNNMIDAKTLLNTFEDTTKYNGLHIGLHIYYISYIHIRVNTCV